MELANNLKCKSRRNKTSKSLRKVSNYCETRARADLQKQSIPRKAHSRSSFRSGVSWKKRSRVSIPLEVETIGPWEENWTMTRVKSATLRGNFRQRVDRRSGEEVRTPLRSMHYPRWGYVTITEVHSTWPLGSGVTYTTPTINSPRPLKRSGARNGDRKHAECEDRDKSGEP